MSRHAFMLAAVLFFSAAAAEPLCTGGPLDYSQLDHSQRQCQSTVQNSVDEGLIAWTAASQAYPEPLTLPVIRVADDLNQQLPDTKVFALMSGKCSTLIVAGRTFVCRAVAYFQSEEGRGNFTIALDDPNDDSHIITFSGDNGRRSPDNIFELPIDRMLLNSKHRPKVDGLPVPLTEMSAGICKQAGNFAAAQVSSIACSATDKNGKKYELQFDSDGSPITLRRIRRSPPTIRLDSR